MTNLDRWLLLVHVAATCYMTGIIWLVQVVHYPLFDRVGADGFARYAADHQRLITWVVAPGMLGEALTAAALLVRRPEGLSLPLLAVGLALLLVIWLSTLFLQIPRHEALVHGFDQAAYRFLVLSNWVRTLAWTARAGLVLWLTAAVIR